MAGPVFLKQPDGSMVPFASAEEAMAFKARGGGPEPGALAFDRNGVPTRAPAPAPLAQEPGVAQGTPEPVLTTPLTMTKNGQTVEMHPDDVARARTMGWSTATADEVTAARELTAAKSPLGTSFLGEIGNELIAGTEKLAEGVFGTATAITDLVGISQGLSGGTTVAALETMALNAFGAQLTVEQQERKLRYRLEHNEVGAAVGEIVSYVGIGGGAFKAAGMAAKGLAAARAVGAGGLFAAGLAEGAGTLGTAARVGVGAAEGLGTSAIAAREAAWIRDEDITSVDIVSQGLPAAVISGVLPLVGVAGRYAAKTTVNQAKKVFGAAKRFKPAAFAGEAEALAGKAGVDVEGFRRAGETSKRLKSHHDTLESLGVDTPEYVARRRAATGAVDPDRMVQDDLTEYYNARLDHGKGRHVASVRQDRIGLMQNSQDRIQWAAEATKDVDDIIKNSGVTTSVPELTDRIRTSLPRGRWDIANANADALDEVVNSTIANARREGTDVLNGADLEALRVNLLENATGDKTKAFVTAAETIETMLKERMDDSAAKELTKALNTKRVASELAKGARRQSDNLGMGGFESFQESGATFAQGVAQAPFHSLSAGYKQIKAVGQIIGRPLREYKLRKNAERFYQGQAAFAEAADSAVLAAFTRTAKSAKFLLSEMDFSKATGGVVPNHVGRAIVTGPGHYLNRYLNSATDDDAPESKRKGVTQLNSLYQRTRQMVITNSGDMIPLMETINARVGTADEHPSLTMNVAAGVLMTMGYLSTQLPKGTQQSPAMPMSPDLPPPEAEMRAYMRKFEAVMNPWSVIEQLGQGTLSKESVEAVSHAYPAFYMRLSERVMRYLGAYPGRLPYEKACQMEIMLQSPGMLVPQNRPRFQATYTQVSKMVTATAGVGPGGKPPPPPRSGAPSLSQQLRSPVNQAIDNIHN